MNENDNNMITADEKFQGWLQTPGLEICAVCLKPRKKPDETGNTEGHTRKMCGPYRANADEKKRIAKMRKRFGRLLDAQAQQAAVREERTRM